MSQDIDEFEYWMAALPNQFTPGVGWIVEQINYTDTQS